MRYGLVIISVLIQIITSAQNSLQKLRTFSTRQGLSNNWINNIIKDSRGYLWIGTAEGLNRFDGKHFLNFFADDNTAKALSGNNIFDILEYQPGHLLIATDNGLSVFNIFSNKFENDKIKMPELQTGSHNLILSLFKDKLNRILIVHSGKIDVLDSSLKHIQRLTDLPWAKSLQGVMINNEPWFQDSQNRLWLASDNYGVFIIDEKKQHVYSFQNNPFNYPFLVKKPIRGILYDEINGIVWYSRWGSGLEKYDLTKKKYQQQLFDLPPFSESSCINSIIKKSDGKLICGGGQDIYNVDPQTLQFTVINESGKTTSRRFFNDGDHIWLGTETKGLMQFASNTSYVQQFSLPYSIKDYTNFSTGIIRSQNGMLYMAYGLDGLLEIDLKSYNINRYTFPPVNGKNQSVHRICEDKENNLWVGALSGLYIFEKNTKKFVRPSWMPSLIASQEITYLYCDSKGNLWMSFTNPNSLGYYSKAEKKFYYYKNYLVNNKRVFNDSYRISRFTEDDSGNIWMISYNKGGLLCYNTDSKTWKSYPRSQKNKKLLSEIPLYGIAAAENNSLWLTNNYGLGLAKYNYATDSISYIKRKDGLLSNNILAISRGKNNSLFLVSPAGINYFNPQTKEISSFSLNDENVSWSFAYTQFYDSISNQLIYGLNDRIIFIDNTIWETNNRTQLTFIDNVTVNNRSSPIDPNAGRLLLSHSQKNVMINFSSNNYFENSSVSYAFKMDGVDKEWTISNELTSAHYTNLSPGNYTFLVKAKNQGGEWGPVNNSLKIRIRPAFWQSTWFIISILLLVFGLTYWLIKQRFKSIRKSAELKQKLSESEMLALRSQMNPHFIFNCLNSIDNLIQTNQKEKATGYLAKFAKLIRSILENSKKDVIPCWKDLETLQLYIELEALRWDKPFTYRIDIDEKIVNGDYKVPPMVIQPFVENAIQHGLLNKMEDDKQLDIKVYSENGSITYIVQDNGVGRKQADKYKTLNRPSHQSLGVQITTERINLYNRHENGSVKIIDLYTNENIPAGTRVEVQLINDA